MVVGLWGAMTFGPFIAHHIAPVIARNAPDVPVLDYFRGNTGNGEGMLVSGLVLAVMIIPIVASTTRDLIHRCRCCRARARPRWGCPIGSPCAGSPCRGVQRHRRRRGSGTGECAGRDHGHRHGVRGGAVCAAVQHQPSR